MSDRKQQWRTLEAYSYHLRDFEAHLRDIGIRRIRSITPTVLTGFITALGLGDAEPARVLGHDDRAVLWAADRIEHALHLGAAQDQRELLAPDQQVVDLGLPLERDAVE